VKTEGNPVYQLSTQYFLGIINGHHRVGSRVYR
jgi:hypothetical protein